MKSTEGGSCKSRRAMRTARPTEMLAPDGGVVGGLLEEGDGPSTGVTELDGSRPPLRFFTVARGLLDRA